MDDSSLQMDTTPFPSPTPDSFPLTKAEERDIESVDANLKDSTATVGPQDEALEFLGISKDSPQFVFQDENRGVLSKIDRHLMPIMFVIYFLQLMDKQTLSFSSVFGISRDAGLVGEEYSFLGSILSIAQLIVQPFAAYFLVKVRLSVFVPIIIVCWGATLACMAAARDFPTLVVSRFFLGAFEAPIQPAFILVGQIWYRREEQGYRLAIWYSNNGWVNIFGSLIMFGLGHITTTVLHSYQIMFVLLGAITFVVGAVSFLIFPDSPLTCKFLTKEEKVVAVERIRANQQGLKSTEFKVKQVVETLLDPKSWCWMAMAFCSFMPTAGIATFGPLILRGFGFNDFEVMLLLIPYGVIQVLTLVVAFWASRKYKVKSAIALASLIPSIIATAILLHTGRSKAEQGILLAGYYMQAGHNAVMPMIINWQSSNVAGHTKKTTTTACMTLGTITGGIVGPLMFGPKDRPYYHRGIVAMLACHCVCIGIILFTIGHLRYLNRRNERRRVKAGKKAEIVDYSMMTPEEAECARDAMKEAGSNVASAGLNALNDMTDLQNDEFIYVY